MEEQSVVAVRGRTDRGPVGLHSHLGSRFRRLSQRSLNALWVVPALVSLVSYGVATALVHVRPTGSLARLLWPGDAAAAVAMLQIVAGSVVTATSLTFSLVVVALQLASQQFSPRLLRGFARSWVIQAVLAVLVSTFVFSVTVLRELRGDRTLPSPALAVAFLLGLAAVGALLVLLASIVRGLRIDTMMLRVHAETRQVMDESYARYGDDHGLPDGLQSPSAADGLVATTSSGFVTEVDSAPLVRAAEQADALVWLLARPGDHLVVGSPIAAVRGATRDLTPAVQEAVRLGYERTLEQDVAFGFRQLVDIAVKALSPALNDPVTATHAVGHLADLLVRLNEHRLGPTVHRDAAGRPRVVVPDRDVRYYLDLACAQVRRFGSREPTVLIALARLLRDVAVAARDDEQRDEVARQVDLVRASTAALGSGDAAAVSDMCRRVHHALEGRVLEAYADRAGETRST